MAFTPETVTRELRRFERDIRPAVRRPVGRARNETRKRMERKYKTTSPGRSIFRKTNRRHDNPPLIIELPRPTSSSGVDTFTIKLRGMAALMEDGSRTKAHTILPTPGIRILAFTIGSNAVFTKRVQHPGGRVPRTRVGATELRRMGRGLRRDVGVELGRAIRKRGLN